MSSVRNALKCGTVLIAALAVATMMQSRKPLASLLADIGNTRDK
jgi:hypothetical protein